MGHDLEGAKITLNEYLDRWLEIAVKPRVRPSDGVKLPQQSRREMRALTVEQVRIFLTAALATPHGPALALAVATRMRPSEYLGLKWQDVDWARQTISVVRSLRRLNGRWCFADTKRWRSRQLIKLQNWIVVILRGLYIVRTGATTANDRCPEAIDLVFKTASGHPINADCLAKHFKSILALAGLPRIRLYDLRHTAATLALAAGVSPKVVSEQLGHASAAFTLDTYAHVLPHMQDEAATKVEEMLFGKGGLISN